MGISEVLLFRQVIYHESIRPLCQMEIIRFAIALPSFHKQEIRDFIGSERLQRCRHAC